jgi:protein arginine kinase activator
LICQACKLVDASVQFTEVVGEQKRSTWLCNDCAQTRGLFVAISPAAAQANAPEAAGGVDAAHAVASRRCACGTSLVNIRRSGRVGCAECYETFADVLAPLLRRVHGRTEHGGGAK